MDEKVLKALGDARRYALLQMLAEHGYCVRALALRSNISEAAVSQHLKILREAGLVDGIRHGQYTHYRVNREALGAVVEELQTLLGTQRKPCDRPFYGCEQAQYVRCGSYVPPEKREKENEEC